MHKLIFSLLRYMSTNLLFSRQIVIHLACHAVMLPAPETPTSSFRPAFWWFGKAVNLYNVPLTHTVCIRRRYIQSHERSVGGKGPK